MTTKSKKKMETVSFTSPFGVARFPKLNAPDTEGKYADGKFKTGVVFDEAGAAKVREAMQAAAKQLLPGVPSEDINWPLKEMFDKDRDTGTKTSVGFGFNAKSQRRPLVIDAKKTKLPESAKIGGGSEIRIGGAFAAYEKTSKMAIVENGKKTIQDVVEKGLTIYLNSVQVRKLVAGGGFSDGSEFEEVEGFEYDASGDGEGTTDDATDL